MISVNTLRDYRATITVSRLLLLLGSNVLQSDKAGGTSNHDRSTRRPQFGSAKGQITMSDDFDNPLEDFNEYM